MPQESSNSEALTPNHFILGSSIGRKEQVRVLPHPAEALRSSYQRAAALTHHFWDRWLKEYVPTLHRRRAKVEEVFPGRDGRVRQAVVRTANGKILKRPVVKLARVDAEMDRE
uniref:DUF5641 domain-containing protein n=1 Tax=Anopheles minimus TaxID=112268 RepID=A0A182WHM1_9DIPT